MSGILIKEIYWKRAILYLRYASDKPQILSLKDDNREVPFEDGGESGLVCLNVSNVNGEMLPEGVYSIIAREAGAENAEKSASEIAFSGEILKDIAILDRVFRYNGGRYLAWFNCEDDGTLIFYTEFAMKNPKPDGRSAKQNFMTAMANLEYKFFHGISRKKKNSVLFFSQTSTVFSDNMKAVYDRMMERGFGDKYKIDIELREEAGGKRGLLGNIALARRLAGYNYIFVDNYVPIFTGIKPAADVKFMQLWHAGVGFKSVGYARFGVKGSPHAFQSSHRRYTHAFVGNEKLKDVYKEVFGISRDKFVATGMPRLEHFLDEDRIKTAKRDFYDRYPDLEGKRVLLFAPTYRGTGQKDAYYDYDKLNLPELAEALRRTNSVIIFKWHHFIHDIMDIPSEYSDVMLDMSDKVLNDLMYVSDVLITDYSSCYYDYLLLRRPIIFYMYDEEIYIASRGVGEVMSKIAPGLVVNSMEELIEALEDKDIPIPAGADYMIDQCLTNGDYLASDRIIDNAFGY